MQNVQSVLNVIAGREYQLKIIDISKDITGDLFYNLYCNAFKEVEKIISENEKKEKDISETANNIIAFCGERGQGKSSAMLSFSKLLSNCNEKNVMRNFSNNIEKLSKCTFHILTRVDPTELENCHSILSVIISRIFHDFKNKVNKGKDTDKSTINKLLQQFQQCFKNIDVIKDENAFEKLNYGYEDDLEKLSMLSDSANIKKDFSDLVNDFLTFIFDKKQDNFLVIQVDDTDLNVSKAYEIVEDIRKYFMIPNVIVLMATNADLLLYAIEQNFQKSFKELIEKNEITVQTTHEMASKYINKLIPGSRRIDLPDFSINGSQDKIFTLGLEYIDLDEKYSEKETKLLKYKKHDGEDIVSLQDTLLRFIFEKTGLVFAKNNNSLHRIIPNNTRTLANFMSVLNDMETLNHEIDINLFDNGEIEKRINNLKKFEEYFINTWIEENVDISVRSYLVDWTKSPINYKNKQIVYFLSRNMPYDAIMGSNRYTSSNDVFKKICDYYDDRIDENISYNFTIFDVIELLTLIESNFPQEAIFKLSFAIKTLFSIEMNRYIWQQILLEKSQIEKSIINVDIDIVQSIGDIWGEKIDVFLRKENNRISRSRGESSVSQNVLQSFYINNPYSFENYIISSLMYDFVDAGTNDDLIDINFNVSYPLIRLIQPLGYIKHTFEDICNLLNLHTNKSTDGEEFIYKEIERIQKNLGKPRLTAIYCVSNLEVVEKLKLNLETKSQASSDYSNNLKDFYVRIQNNLHDLDYLCLKEIDFSSLIKFFDQTKKLLSQIFQSRKPEPISDLIGLNFLLSNLVPYTKTYTLDLLNERINKTLSILRQIERRIKSVDLSFEIKELETIYANLVKKEKLSKDVCLNKYQPKLNKLIKSANQKLKFIVKK